MNFQITSSASGGENSGISLAAGRPTEAFGANTLDIPKLNIKIKSKLF